MSRLPIRVRVTLAFTAVMAVVLVAVGLLLYLRLESQLDESLDTGLRSRAGDLAALAGDTDGRLATPGAISVESDESFAQILSPDGDQDHRHHRGERQRDADPDRQTAHPGSWSRRR